MEKFTDVPGESTFFDLTPEEVTLFFFLLGLAAAPSFTIDELNVLANGLFLTAQALFTIASQRALLNDAITAQEANEEAKQSKEDSQSAKNAEKEDTNSVKKLELEIKKLQEQIESMQNQIKKLVN